MRAALVRVDVVGEREHGLDVFRVPLHRDLDLALVVGPFEVDDVLVHGVFGLVDVTDEVANAALVEELLGRAAGALVGEDDPQPAGEERRLTEALHEGVRRQLELLEDLRVGHVRNGRSRLALRNLSDHFQLRRRDAAREFLPVDLAIAAHFRPKPLRQRIDDRDADAVQAAGHLVSVTAELAAGVELRQHDRQCRLSLLRHDVDRDPRSLVSDGHGVIGMEDHLEVVVAACEGFVDGVVDDLVNEVMQSPRARRADVHARAQADRLEAFEDGDVLSGIGSFSQ